MPLSLVTLLIAMSSIQFGATLSRGLFPILGASGATFWRLSLAAVILLLCWRPWRTPLQRQQVKTVLLYGLALGLMNLSFYFAIERIPLGIAVALEFTGPLAVALFNSRKIFDFLWALLAIVGLYLLLPLSTEGQLDLFGVLMALMAGLCWALYIIFGQRSSQQLPGHLAATWGMLGASLFVTPVAVWQHGLTLFQPQLLGIAAMVAVLSSALPYSLEMIALKRLKAKTFGILMSLEPAIATLMGWIFLQEVLGWRELSGIAAIMLASLGATIFQRGSN